MSIVARVSSQRETGNRIEVHDDGRVRCRALRAMCTAGSMDENAPLVYRDSGGNTVAQLGIDGMVLLAGQSRRTQIPRIASVSPAEGATAGGDTVTIAGEGFTPDATVTFDGVAGAVTFVSEQELSVVTPAGSAGATTVGVEIPNQGEHLRTGLFEYWAAPTVSAIAPAVGQLAGGDAAAITGTGFQAGATVTIGGTAATNVVFRNSTKLTCTTPAGTAGATDVVVTNPDGQSATLAGGFTYASGPSVSSVTPNYAHHQGGVPITIGGSGFLAGAAVSLRGTACTNVVVADANTITCDTPALGAGLYDLRVENAGEPPGVLADAVEIFTRTIVTIPAGGTQAFPDRESWPAVSITEAGDLRLADQVRFDL